MSTVTLEDFSKLDIRIGKVVSVEKLPDADKLVKFVFDFGTEQRQIIAGIALFFTETQLAELVGKEVPVLVNLEPRTFRGHKSEGMLVAADHNGPVFLHPAHEIPPGSVVK